MLRSFLMADGAKSFWIRVHRPDDAVSVAPIRWSADLISLSADMMWSVLEQDGPISFFLRVW